MEARLLRELGERLVKQPEVAFVELIKNAYDADAESCTLTISEDAIVVADDGHGMTLAEFEAGWMRIGTSLKASTAGTPRYGRSVTGEKGIGRFAVRFLGGLLVLRTVAYDFARKRRTVLEARFNWTDVDQHEDLGRVAVPYTLRAASAAEALGTTLEISELKVDLDEVQWHEIRTASIALLSPLRALFASTAAKKAQSSVISSGDPGFSLLIRGPAGSEDELQDVAAEILESYVLRAVVSLRGQRLLIDIYTRPKASNSEVRSQFSIRDMYRNEIGSLQAEIRFYPKRKGSFAGLPVDGRRALGWVAANSGVAVYDRSFRVLPYGTQNDDWLNTARDTARRARQPQSTIAEKHFPMSPSEATSTELNYMLRLPHPQQLIGVVLVEGARTPRGEQATGLVAAADREGFVDNAAFSQLHDIIRGAVEAIAHVDRKLQKKSEDADRRERIRKLKADAQAAIAEIRANPRLKKEDRIRLIDQFVAARSQAEEHEASIKTREMQLETLSLLGVVAGFMTHEFGVALDTLERSRKLLSLAAKTIPTLRPDVAALGKHIEKLKEFAVYSRAYIGASETAPSKRFGARARIQQVVRIFGDYSLERGIQLDIDIARDLLAPAVPVALYNGVALNLYTNALKAVTSRAGQGERRISFRAWNSGRTHTLLVADTGVGIPSSLRERVFDPLITTTSLNSDALGSGLGLGLTLVRRAVESFHGKVGVVDAPPGFSTAVEVNFPLGSA